MSLLYPMTEPSQPDQTFWLAKIRELNEFLAKEADTRHKVQKKYLRAVNIAHGASTAAGLVGLALESTGLPQLATGFGVIPRIVLSACGMGAFGVNLVCDAVIRKCTKKAMKYAEIARCAADKLNLIHKQVSEGLQDYANISRGNLTEYWRRRRNTSGDLGIGLGQLIRNRARTADIESLKKMFIEKGRQEEMAKYAKFMATFNSQ